LQGNSQSIGIFLGLSVHDTSQVIGSALTYSSLYSNELVLKIATITKLSRNLLLAGVVPYFSHSFNSSAASSNLSKFQQIKQYTPVFVFAFVGMSGLRSLGDLTIPLSLASEWKSVYYTIGGGSQYLLGTALAGVGLQMNFKSVTQFGYTPFVVGLLSSGIVASTGFVSCLVMSRLFL